MRVLHLPTATGGNAWNLSLAERALGIDSKVFYFKENIYGFDCDKRIAWNNNKYTYPFKALAFYIKELKNFDILHFNFGKTLFSYRYKFINMIDLAFLKRSHIKTVMTYQGSDARIAQYCLGNYDVTYFRNYPKEMLERELKADEIRKMKINTVDRFIDQIYAINPDLLNTLPTRSMFRPYTKIQLEDWEPIYSDYENKTIRIVHAPTSRLIKGTDVVIKTIANLRECGFDVELILLENMTNKEVIEILKGADIVIDQLYAGWYGGFAVEAMALGKPVIAYIRESDLVHIPNQMACDIPIINATDYNLEQKIIGVIENRPLLRKIARKSRNYVENWHDSKKNARTVVENYKKLLG